MMPHDVENFLGGTEHGLGYAALPALIPHSHILEHVPNTSQEPERASHDGRDYRSTSDSSSLAPFLLLVILE
jgi:hypothetical protein